MGVQCALAVEEVPEQVHSQHAQLYQPLGKAHSLQDRVQMVETHRRWEERKQRDARHSEEGTPGEDTDLVRQMMQHGQVKKMMCGVERRKGEQLKGQRVLEEQRERQTTWMQESWKEETQGSWREQR